MSAAPAAKQGWATMVPVPGGTFAMGSEDFYPEERPVRQVTVSGFLMDERQVTAADFRRFVRETGYVTVAERPLEAADYPDADPELLVPGSLVFRKTTGPVPLDDTFPAHPGSAQPARAARSMAATGTRSSRSPTRTRRPTPPGLERRFRLRPSGSTPLAEDSRAPRSPGATSTHPAARRWRTPGRESSPGRT